MRATASSANELGGVPAGSSWTMMAGRSRALFASRNGTKRHGFLPFLLAISEIGCACLKKKSATWSPAYINETKTPTYFFQTSSHVLHPCPRGKIPCPGVSNRPRELAKDERRCACRMIHRAAITGPHRPAVWQLRLTAPAVVVVYLVITGSTHGPFVCLEGCSSTADSKFEYASAPNPWGSSGKISMISLLHMETAVCPTTPPLSPAANRLWCGPMLCHSHSP